MKNSKIRHIHKRKRRNIEKIFWTYKRQFQKKWYWNYDNRTHSTIPLVKIIMKKSERELSAQCLCCNSCEWFMENWNSNTNNKKETVQSIRFALSATIIAHSFCSENSKTSIASAIQTRSNQFDAFSKYQIANWHICISKLSTAFHQ